LVLEMTDYNALISIKCAGTIKTHIIDSTDNYATLCGMDGDDPHPGVDQRIMPATGVQVDCPQCVGIWKMAHKIHREQIAKI